MQMNPLISVIVPVYNHANTLHECIASILRQAYRPLEVIVVNDGSTDNFSQVMSKMLNDATFNELNIKVMTQENQGAPAARNRGFKQSQGQYVIFWDADTIAKPLMLELMIKAINMNPQASYVYSQFRYEWKKIKSQAFDPDKLKQMNYIDTTSLIERESFVGWDESLKRFQDWDLWLTMLENKKIGVFVPEVLYRKLVGGRRGMSRWLPSFMFKLPWKTKKVRDYEDAKREVSRKHNLAPSDSKAVKSRIPST